MIEKCEGLLSALEPSGFRDVIMGILTIFIPFVLVFLTDMVNSNQRPIDKLVFSETVLETKKIFWYAVSGLFIFSFFNFPDNTNEYDILTSKIIAVIILVVYVYLFYQQLKKVLDYAEGKKTVFFKTFFDELSSLKFLDDAEKDYEQSNIHKRLTKAFNNSLTPDEITIINKAIVSIVEEGLKYKHEKLVRAILQSFSSRVKDDSNNLDYNVINLGKVMGFYNKMDAGCDKQLCIDFISGFLNAVIERKLKPRKDDNYHANLENIFKNFVTIIDEFGKKEKSDATYFNNNLIYIHFTRTFEALLSEKSLLNVRHST